MMKGINRKALDSIQLFCKKYGIHLIPYSKSEELQKALHVTEFTNETTGICYKYGKDAVIFYDDRRDTNIKRQTLLHELGHVLTTDWDDRAGGQKPMGELAREEFTAEVFACMVSALMFMDELKMLHSEEAAK